MERVFLVSNNRVIKNRTCLLPETVKQNILLRYWKISDINSINALLSEEGEVDS